MLLRNSAEQYLTNFKTILVFALLLAFAPAFAFFENIFLSSGSVLLDYNIGIINPAVLALEAGLVALYLLFYSFFVSILVFDVRRGLSKLKLHIYLTELIQKFTLRIFAFYAVYTLAIFAFTVCALALGAPLWAASAIVLLATLAFLFVPQAVVIEEEGLRHALLSNFEFLASHPRSFAIVTIVGCVLLAILQFVEFAVDQMALIGSFVSLLLLLVLVLPFVEVMKTYLYMMRFDLIKEHETTRSKFHRGH
ncbi:MAG: hypothetical protein NTW59_03540 [Candidatus Diapherotrites archaeon]|nr:hypothetical protein [Candidatus Diapherotrites archaeon]